MEKMNDGIFEALKDFIAKETGVKPHKIMEESELEDDLGIFSDDAYDLLLDFGKKFNVDVSKFNAAEYVSAEGDFILPEFIKTTSGNMKLRRKKLRVKTLLAAIKAGRLDEDVINS